MRVIKRNEMGTPIVLSTAEKPLLGVVKYVMEDRGFGFIENLDNGVDIFFHATDRGSLRSAGERSSEPLITWDADLSTASRRTRMPQPGELIRFMEAIDHHDVGRRLKAALWVPQDEWLRVKTDMRYEKYLLEHFLSHDPHETIY